ncbi:MAG TPA: chemotaxis-specific protein-glutamate methyltransferase CheB, partial [Rhodocyclaceae bacterium]|nr:chemotaxis-specific protein-glutamate methyltransferase CheB [Rhodocyclaceae bacterium]
MTIKVLVVDDSALIRGVLSEIINAAPDMCVVAAVEDAARAGDAIKRFNPDVMTLDVEMPGMNGLDFLEQIMRNQPMPVVMISTHTARGSNTTLRALELGAIDFVAKPKIDPICGMRAYANELCEKIRAAQAAKSWVLGRPRTSVVDNKRLSNTVLLDERTLKDKLILIGASTGGTEAIKEVLMHLPANIPGILVVQHMPEMFTGPFAKRLDDQCPIHVKQAEHGERIKHGTAYIAPGHSHLLVKRVAGSYVCELSQEISNSYHRPAVDVLFASAAR